MTNHTVETFTLGHSPDPDDAFMFYAMAQNKIDLRGYRFEHRLEDIQTLNERALRGELHISAISVHAYAHVASKYALLPCGASMGDGYGPILIRKRPTPNVQLRKDSRAGSPMPNDDSIRETAARQFLDGKKIVDLGKWWKEQTGFPLPLGGNVVRKDIPPAVRRDLSENIRESIDYGLAHRDAAVRHSLPYARDMDAKLAGKFIGMYVNEFTRDYGEVGRAAIRRFLTEAHNKGYIDVPIEVEFVE